MKTIGGNRFDKMVSQFKAYIITEELIKHEGNICKAAEALGMHRNSLSRNIEEHEVDLQAIKRKFRDGRDRGSNVQVLEQRTGKGSVSGHTSAEAGAMDDAAGEGTLLENAGA